MSPLFHSLSFFLASVILHRFPYGFFSWLVFLWNKLPYEIKIRKSIVNSSHVSPLSLAVDTQKTTHKHWFHSSTLSKCHSVKPVEDFGEKCQRGRESCDNTGDPSSNKYGRLRPQPTFNNVIWKKKWHPKSLTYRECLHGLVTAQ